MSNRRLRRKAVHGRSGEVANDRLGALHFANSESGRVSGFEKVIWPEWGELGLCILDSGRSRVDTRAFLTRSDVAIS